MRFFWASVLFLGACADPHAPDKCEDLVDAICANAVDHCAPGLTQAACTSEVLGVVDCSSAVKTSETYDDCLDLFESAEECIVTQDVPAECDGSVLALE